MSARPEGEGVAVILHTSEYRGDHSAEVTEAYQLGPGETVEQLVARLLGGGYVNHYRDWIELRVAVAYDPPNVPEPAE